MQKDFLKKALEDWVAANVVPYCAGCSKLCCTEYEPLSFELDELDTLQLFQERGLRAYRLSELKLGSVKRWLRNSSIKVEKTNGKCVEKPSIIETPCISAFTGQFVPEETDYKLYADKCPFLRHEEGCTVHNDTRRPGACIEYPVNLTNIEDSTFAALHLSCTAMQQGGEQRFKAQFPDLDIIPCMPPERGR